jgi:hypothetical protein
MKYIADILTLTRFVLAIMVFGLAVFDNHADIGTGFILIIIAELTDAFDGTFAARFPFPKNKAPKYRKYAAKYDMMADVLIAFVGMLFFTLRVNLVAGLTIMISYGVMAIVVDIVVYGKLLGHPDDATKTSLVRKDFSLAKKIIMARRAIYLILIGVVAIWMLFATNWELTLKIMITVIAALLSVFFWFFLAQRRKHISRDAVEIEEKLAKK